MKKNKIIAIISVVLLVLTFVLASCGGSNPKSLAKEAYELRMQRIAAYEEEDNDKLEALNEQDADHMTKFTNLSEADQAIYLEEYHRLLNNQ